MTPIRSHRVGLRRIELAFGLLSSAVISCGCVQSLQSGIGFSDSSNPDRTNSGGSAGSVASANRAAAVAASPGGTLTVGTESLFADAIWEEHKDDLTTKSKLLSESELHDFVEVRSVQLIADELTESLLYQQAMLRLDTRVTEIIERQVDAEIRKVVTAKHGGVQRRYEKELESKGQSLHELRKTLRREFLVSGYLEVEIKPKVAEPTRADLLAAYEESVARMRKPARRSMSLIDVRISEFLPHGVNEPSREQWAAARADAHARIRTAQTMIQDGSDFADVARNYSHGLQAVDGGRWGWITASGVRERFVPAVKALESLKGGQVSNVVETDDAFFLVRCDEFDPGYEPDFESVQPELADRHFRIQFNHQIAVYVEELRRKAGISTADLERFHAAVVEAAYKQIRES